MDRYRLLEDYPVPYDVAGNLTGLVLAKGMICPGYEMSLHERPGYLLGFEIPELTAGQEPRISGTWAPKDVAELIPPKVYRLLEEYNLVDKKFNITVIYVKGQLLEGVLVDDKVVVTFAIERDDAPSYFIERLLDPATLEEVPDV